MTRFAFVADAARIHVASAWLEAQCAAAGLDETAGATLAMVSEEVLCNIVTYGGPPPPTIELAFALQADAIEVRIADDGVAFDPTAVPIPQLSDDIALRSVGGLGLVIVRAMMDEVVYAREAGRNRLILRKRR